MATRSRIAYSDYDVVSSYHHWDGYPEGLGAYLVKNYPTLEDAKRLVDGGDMSTCMTEDGKPLYYGKRSEWTDAKGNKHSANYGEDEAWERVKPVVHEYGVSQYGDPLCTRISGVENTAGLEYLYIFMKGKWHVTDDGIDFDPVEDEIARRQANGQAVA